MKMFSTVVAAAALLGVAVISAQPASALTANPGLTAPSLVEDVACRMVRSRVVRPNGRVVYRQVRKCTPGFTRPRSRCTVERQRVVRPNGAVVFKTVRRCR